MSATIHAIPFGAANGFIVKDQGTILIDCGPPKKAKVFINYLQAMGISPQDIQLILITHGHWDHIGSAAEIKALTGAKIAMHRGDKDLLEKSLRPPLQGVGVWGDILTKMMALMMPFITIRPAEVDIVLDDATFSLDQYGIAGKVIYTPGHTAGSVSILLDSGQAIIGDMAMNKLPMRFSPDLPVVAEDLPQLIDSWKRLLAKDIKCIYPSHGNQFSPEIMRKVVFLSELAKK